MSTDKEAKRLKALQGWASAVSAAGHRAPGTDNLEAIAARPEQWTGIDRAVVDPWVEAIEWILKQVKFGVHDPVMHMPSDLLVPKGGQGIPAPAPEASPAPPPTSATDATAEGHQALVEWWEKAVEEERPKIGSLNRTKLLQVVKSGKRTPTEIADILRGADAKSFAAEIARVLASLSPLTPANAEQAVLAQAQAIVDEAAIHSPATTSTINTGATPSSEQDTHRMSPTPTAQPARPTQPAPPTSSEPEFDPALFAEYEFNSLSSDVAPIRTARNSGNGWSHTWPPHPEGDRGTTIYRLVSGDEYPPYAPEKADFVTSTTATAAIDIRPFITAVRHFQVWCNRGTDPAAALRAQPTLHAQTAVVSTVENFEVREDDGRVIGRWTSRPGTAAVQVYRIPIERAATGADNPQYRICTTTPNLSGFVDVEAEPGRRYLYQVRCEATVDGTTRLSGTKQQEIAVAAVLTPVSDLEVVTHERERGPEFDLTWTDPPSGHVVIYRTAVSPSAGLGASSLAYSALNGAGLRDEDQLPDPPSIGEDGRSVVAGIPWPRDWNRAYFTPVTVLDDTVHVGTTTYATRTGLVIDPQVVERVNKQILTFGWPVGAASVLVYMGARGQGAEAGLSGQPVEISQGEYARFGGLHFPSPLPPRGCSLHAVAVSYAGGERNGGTPVTTQYPGMMRMRYDIAFKRGLTGKATVTVTVTSELELPISPPMVLVHNPDRMPLSYRDGTALPVVPDSSPNTEPVTQFQQPRIGPTPVGSWRADVRDKRGFVRLFVELPAEQLRTVALLDPSVDKLHLDGSSGWRR
ncbi:hypothetical protein M2280_005362 [Prescottella agglutinans]|uniref:Uncharacterized protein n=1 Tax=Prescottella agglutinans TaxID=1644129 RepID=A0ABT6MIQ1_9NOCA|nr:hypothetical protein [Prescottella agglutinans]